MSARDDRHPIDPGQWLRGWMLNCRRAAQAETTEPVTEWFVGTTKPAEPGYYDRMFTDGLWRQWWSGLAWHSGRGAPPHWRQVGDYPCWRGLRAPWQGRPSGAPQFPVALRKMWTGGEVQAWIDREWANALAGRP